MTDATNHAEVIRDYLEGPMMSAGPSKALAALDALTRELEEARADVERLKESMQRHFVEEHLAGDGPEIDRWKRQCAALEQRHEEDAAEIKRLNHALTDCNAEVLAQSARIATLEEVLGFYARLEGWDQGRHTGVAVYAPARAALAPKEVQG